MRAARAAGAGAVAGASDAAGWPEGGAEAEYEDEETPPAAAADDEGTRGAVGDGS